MGNFNFEKFLDAEEDGRLIESLENDKSRDGLMLSLLRYCGMRPSEMLGLRVCDLNRAQGSIFIRGLKGSNSRELPIRPDLFERLWAASRRKEKEARVFTISYPRLVQIWDHWRPCRKPLKSLRHTLAVEVYRKSKDIQLVQRVLGHMSLSSTLVYQSFSYDQAAFREVLF